MEPPYQSRPLPQRRRRLGRRSLFPLRAPPPQPPVSAAPTGRHYALPPSRAPASPSSLCPPPPSPPRRRRRRHRRRRLLLRAPLAFIESKQASWRRPPSPSQRAPRPPPPLQHPGRPLAAATRRNHSAPGGVSPCTPLPQAPPLHPHRWGRWSGPPRSQPSLPFLFPLSSFLSCPSLLFFLFLTAALFFIQLSFICLGLFTFVSSLPSFSLIFLPSVLPVNHMETWTSSQTFDLSQYPDLPKDETFNREHSYEFSSLKYAEKIT